MGLVEHVGDHAWSRGDKTHAVSLGKREHRREGGGEGRGGVLQSSLAQKASCVFLSASPPGESRPMLALAPSELRVTLYSGPE